MKKILYSAAFITLFMGAAPTITGERPIELLRRDRVTEHPLTLPGPQLVIGAPGGGPQVEMENPRAEGESDSPRSIALQEGYVQLDRPQVISLVQQHEIVLPVAPEISIEDYHAHAHRRAIQRNRNIRIAVISSSLILAVMIGGVTYAAIKTDQALHTPAPTQVPSSQPTATPTESPSHLSPTTLFSVYVDNCKKPGCTCEIPTFVIPAGAQNFTQAAALINQQTASVCGNPTTNLITQLPLQYSQYCPTPYVCDLESMLILDCGAECGATGQQLQQQSNKFSRSKIRNLQLELKQKSAGKSSPRFNQTKYKKGHR